jgi:hypothetical protein
MRQSQLELVLIFGITTIAMLVVAVGCVMPYRAETASTIRTMIAAPALASVLASK